MANRGLALYKGKDSKMYVLEILYEYRDQKLAGFRKNDEIYTGNFYRIDPIEHGYKISKVDFSKEVRATVPIAVHFMKLPGSWVTFDITKQYTNPEEMIKNKTVKNVLDKFFGLQEIKKIVKEEVNKIINIKNTKTPQLMGFYMIEKSGITLKQEKPQVSFTAVSIEDESEKNKINNVFDLLQEQGKIPKDFIRPQFKDGTLDYHMTIIMGELPPRLRNDLDKEVTLNIKTLGISEDAIALGVSGDYFSDNEFQHITLAFKHFPSDSKVIKEWKPLENIFSVIGVIREFDVDKKIIKRGVFDEANQIEIGNFQAQAVPAGKGSVFPKEKI
jgi:hypothetical protein